MKLNWDASIIKNIPITERVRFQMRAEFFIAESQTCPPASTSENEGAQLRRRLGSEQRKSDQFLIRMAH
jgi:hypothetical protein